MVPIMSYDWIFRIFFYKTYKEYCKCLDIVNTLTRRVIREKKAQHSWSVKVLKFGLQYICHIFHFIWITPDGSMLIFKKSYHYFRRYRKNRCKITLNDKKYQILFFQFNLYIIFEVKIQKLFKKLFHAKIQFLLLESIYKTGNGRIF